MKKTIYLAGGCFWGVQEYYSRLKGVLEVTAGYCNGTTAFPKYEEVKTGTTGHAETVKIDYDDSLISLEDLLNHYLRFVDPYSLNKQGEDEGSQYRTGIYYVDLLDGINARTYLDEHLEKGYKIEVSKMCNFFKAEEYHQNYLKKNVNGYCHINLNLIKKGEQK
ncbi:MAG: peptide-methionine (S)-S-oxide reductase MsrA [Bacilli bacterium]|nr:peptide-methionine (S)-S-oxide reductase MsrA [Bacilli bacterium]MBR1581993.1 peptide-methionine (S)-S-oxide reductase MsrA [Bacilli bacterium]